MKTLSEAAAAGARTAFEAGAGLRTRKPEPPDRRTLDKVRRFSRASGAIRYGQIGRREAHDRIFALRRWERAQKKAPRKRNRAVGYIGVEVYEALCRRAAREGGRLDQLSYAGLSAITGFARSAIVAAIARLKALGWLDWIRQYEETGDRGARGPQVHQTFNAYLLKVPLDALARCGIRFGPPPVPDDIADDAARKAAAVKAMELAASPLSGALDRLGAAVKAREAQRETS
jgi:hypothetical protein